MIKKISILLFFACIGISFCSAQPAFSLEDIALNGRFAPKRLRGLTFINANEYLTLEYSEGNISSQIVLHQLNADQKKILLDTRILAEVLPYKNLTVDSYEVIDDFQFLVARETEGIYRFSEKAYYFYIHIKKNKVIPLFPRVKQLYPKLSPDGTKIAFVVENDLYYLDLKTEKTIRLTHDGKKNNLINGTGDWVYEEEFDLTSAFRWSPDSKKIAYLKLDESQVKEYSMDYYRGDYPEQYRFKYPRAGEKNSVATLWLADVKSKKSSKIPVESEYIPRFKFRSDGQLGIMTLPRFQNELEIKLFDTKTNSISTLYKEEDKRYVDLPICFEFLPDGELAISSEKSGRNQLYILDKTGKELYKTTGDFDILAVKQINVTDQSTYLQVAAPSPERKSVVRWDFKQDNFQYITDTTGTADVRMLSQGSFLETFHSGTVRNRISIQHEKKGLQNMLLNDTRAEDSILGKRIFFDIPVNDVTLKAWAMYPPNFDSLQKHPVLFYVYGGPGFQTVIEEFPQSYLLWLNYMTQLGYIVVSVDNRGSGARGAAFKKMTYMRLGQYETEDQIAAAEWMAQQSFIDAERIAIFGWSYGGYLSLMSVLQDKPVFKAAISIAPITNWRFYGTVYAERYMRTPISNPSGYENSAPTLNAGKLSGELLLIHGTTDDNVHFQHSMELNRAMIDAGKQFRLLVYPNRDHGLGAGKTHLHLYKAMTDFLEEKLR